MNKEIIVEGNRRVEITKLIQWKTYINIVEGKPGPELNAYLIKEAQERAKNQFNLPVVLLTEPKQKPHKNYFLFPEMAPVFLPDITCIARLYDYSQYPDADYACLGVVWFQDDFAFPIEEEVIEALKKLPFTKLAKQFEF